MYSLPLEITGALCLAKSAVQSAFFASILSGRPVSGDAPFCPGPRQLIQPATPVDAFIASCPVAVLVFFFSAEKAGEAARRRAAATVRREDSCISERL